MNATLCAPAPRAADRRDFLRQASAGFGWLAFSALSTQWARGGEPASTAGPLAPKRPHFAPRAKRVIFMFMSGGPSHLDTFDWKPELARLGPGGGRGKLLAPVTRFAPAGNSGLMIADIFPQLSQQADHLCLLNGMRTNNPGHQQAIVALHTGNETFVRPSIGAWTVYGLGTEAEDLPGFVTINPIADQGGAMNYGSAFLPATCQGTRLDAGARGVPNVANRHLHEADQRAQLTFIQRANARLLSHDADHPEIEGLIGSYELAYKMQTSVPATLDLDAEPEHVRQLYGLDESATQGFGTQCLMARRLAEKGVRFIQLTRTGWDHHHNLREGLALGAGAIDKPIAGLIADLNQRGMLDETLVLWGGEFGRTPYDDKGDGNGRGHNAKGYSMFMAGGGVKAGFCYGATNEIGQAAVEGVIGTHDLHATVLHLLGLDHERLTFRYAGRDFRLTDVQGKVVHEILA